MHHCIHLISYERNSKKRDETQLSGASEPLPYRMRSLSARRGETPAWLGRRKFRLESKSWQLKLAIDVIDSGVVGDGPLDGGIE